MSERTKVIVISSTILPWCVRQYLRVTAGARPHHRWVRGNLTYTSGNQEAITLWTPEGKKDFIVKQNRSKFGSFAEGSPITVVSQMFKVGPVAMHLECGTKGQDACLSLVYSATVFSEVIRTAE